MSHKPLKRPPAGPAAIAVHDDGNMLWQALRLQRRIDSALLRAQLIDT